MEDFKPLNDVSCLGKDHAASRPVRGYREAVISEVGLCASAEVYSFAIWSDETAAFFNISGKRPMEAVAASVPAEELRSLNGRTEGRIVEALSRRGSRGKETDNTLGGE